MIAAWFAALLVVIGVGVGVEAASHSGVIAYGEACGVSSLAGGPPNSVGVKFPALLHECPPGLPLSPIEYPQLAGVRLLSTTGAEYPIERYLDYGWSAVLPAGTYRAVDVPGCPGPEEPFTVVGHTTTLGIVIGWGCDYS